MNSNQVKYIAVTVLAGLVWLPGSLLLHRLQILAWWTYEHGLAAFLLEIGLLIALSMLMFMRMVYQGKVKVDFSMRVNSVSLGVFVLAALALRRFAMDTFLDSFMLTVIITTQLACALYYDVIRRRRII